MIIIKIPNNNVNERKYSIDIFFDEFLGLIYEIKTGSTDYEIELDNGNKLIFKDHFFNKFKNDLSYLKEENIPNKVEYFKYRYISEYDIPVIFGSEELKIATNKIICGVDIFASSFFMLTRWEEYVNEIKDSHDRFLAKESLAFKNKFLDRPLVNEYVEMLWNMLVSLGFSEKRKIRSYQMLLSHDVDTPFQELFRPWKFAIRRSVGDILKRKDIKLSIKRLNNWKKVRSGMVELDPYNTFNFIMKESEKRGIKSAFYFLPDGSAEDPNRYTVRYPIIQELLKSIYKRGHEIGYHASYDTYLDRNKTVEEVQLLLKTLCKIGIKNCIAGGRQHYLRWSNPDTYRNWEEAGLKYDSTLTFADYPGFRCGVCFEFPVYDILERKTLKMIERPLVVMEGSIISDTYLGLGYSESALEKFKGFKQICKKYNGDFTLLWHNSELSTLESKEFYQRVLDV